VVGRDAATDLAVVRINAESLPAAEFADSDAVGVGEWVVAIGSPFGLSSSVTAGIVSAVGRNNVGLPGQEDTSFQDFLQTDAAINPGNSGGPLVNALGSVIGVNSSIISESGGSVGLGFAIPIDRAMRVAESLISEGAVRRAWVGADVTASDPNRFGRSQWIEVSAVVAGSPAQRAGLRTGQRIVRVNGRAVHTPWDWEARLLDTSVGQPVRVTVQEGGAERTVDVTTQDLPSLTAERVQALRDFEFVTLTPAIRAERNLRSEEGALIVGLSDTARQIGLRQGDLVVSVNQARVRTAQDAARYLGALEGSGQIRVVYERAGRLGAAYFYIGG
jgi:S1-C subfamily serine protease